MAINWNTLKQLALSSKEGMDLTTLPSFPKFVDTPTPKTPSKPAVKYWGGPAKPVQKPVVQQPAAPQKPAPRPTPVKGSKEYYRNLGLTPEQIAARDARQAQQKNVRMGYRPNTTAKSVATPAPVGTRDKNYYKNLGLTPEQIAARDARQVQQMLAAQEKERQAKYARFGLGTKTSSDISNIIKALRKK